MRFCSSFPECNSCSATLRLCCLDTLAHTPFHTIIMKKYYNDTPKSQYELEIPTQHSFFLCWFQPAHSENFLNLPCLLVTRKYLLLIIQLSKASAAHALLISWLLLSKETDKMISHFPLKGLLSMIDSEMAALQLVNWHFQTMKYHIFSFQVLRATWEPSTPCTPVQIASSLLI